MVAMNIKSRKTKMFVITRKNLDFQQMSLKSGSSVILLGESEIVEIVWAAWGLLPSFHLVFSWYFTL